MLRIANGSRRGVFIFIGHTLRALERLRLRGVRGGVILQDVGRVDQARHDGIFLKICGQTEGLVIVTVEV